MMNADLRLVPVLHQGVLMLDAPADRCGMPLKAAARDLETQEMAAVVRLGQSGRFMIDPVPANDLTVSLSRPESDEPERRLHVQVGGWTGAVDWHHGGLISGRARNLRVPAQDQVVVAFGPDGVVAHATAKALDGGRFLMVLPAELAYARRHVVLTLGISGSDYLLDKGRIDLGATTGEITPVLKPLSTVSLAIRIKISTPNLKEAPQWGDYHFANSLAASFERLGHHAGVDTADAWYAHSAQQDVVLKIRGRHRLKVDPTKINIMWLISHPDRIPDDEYGDYDHIAVASEIYAKELKSRGLPSVSVLHQATDARLFRFDPEVERTPACLFVGNSRREYRTMVKWCLKKDIPLDLYGGGWDGILPPDAVRATSVANADLAGYYARHLILLNDHWDSMRENGFLSNRLFDGSAVGTPILTDPVAGLAEVFGDTISQAGDIDHFADLIQDCLANPEPYLERAKRARDIVLGAHTFDHRALQIAEIIDQIAITKGRGV